MEIKLYEPWMREQVVALFALEYGVQPSDFEQLFLAFYEHPFQLEHGVRIVAVEGEKVGGFQSFFYWPVQHNGRTLYTLQSGNSLVHPDFRGKGLFGKMLDYIHQPESGIRFDFLMGFPVEASYNSFIRKQWLNPFNLQWYVLPTSPVFSLFSTPENGLQRHFGTRTPVDINMPSDTTAVLQSAGFDAYRFNFQKDPLFRFEWKQGQDTALFELKPQRRKRVIRELIIGKAVFTNTNEAFVTEAFSALRKAVSKATSVTFISIAINPHVEVLRRVIEMQGFRQIDKKIYFIAKGPTLHDNTDWSKWWIFRGDIDTW